MNGYCPYCMSALPSGGPCPACGREPESYQPSSHHFPPGALLHDRYLVGRVLGEGGFGITYLGLDTSLDRRVAIKEYFPTCFVGRETSLSLEVSCYTKSNQAIYEKGREKFLQEARVMARLDGVEEIVGVLDHFQANNTAYIVMEFLEGETLKELVARQGPVPAQTLLEMVRPVLRAMEAMHQAGIIHRDISPDNLMRMKNGTVKLMDFGCARDIDGQRTKTVTLKHGFAPREQYSGRNQGPWTDVYALCATLYYCLTGKVPPWATERGGEDPLKPPAQLGADLTPAQEEALLGGLAVEIGDRWQSAADLYAALYGVTMDGVPWTAEKRHETPRRGEEQKEHPQQEQADTSARRGGLLPAWKSLSRKARAGIAGAICVAVAAAAAVPLLAGGNPSVPQNSSTLRSEAGGKQDLQGPEGAEPEIPGPEEAEIVEPLPTDVPEASDTPAHVPSREEGGQSSGQTAPAPSTSQTADSSSGTNPSPPPQQTTPAQPTREELTAQAEAAASNGRFSTAADTYRQMRTLGYFSAGELGTALQKLGDQASFDQEYEIAAGLYQEAVTLGNQTAKRSLAISYEFGSGVEQSYEKAFQLNLELAQSGYSGASVYYDVADAYTEGIGTARDPQQAIYWWERYLDTGDAKGDTREKIEAKIAQLREG